MGKREFLIIGAFIVLGVVAYQLTAPPSKDGEGFSFSRLFSHLRREISSNHTRASVTSTGTMALGASVEELRLAVSRSGVTIKGERRDDVAWELWVEAGGADEAGAREAAGKARLIEDDLGTVRALRLRFADGSNSTAKLTLAVPARLLVRIEAAGRASVTGVRAVDLRNLSGETTISEVSEVVQGSHRAGLLTVDRVRAVNLSLVASQASLTNVSGSVTLNVRNGECTLTRASGPIDATLLNAVFALNDSTGAARINGENGSLKVTSPAGDLIVDARRMRIDVNFSAPVASSIITSDAPLRLTFAGPPAATIDALVTDTGEIRAQDLGLVPSRDDREVRVRASVGGGGPRIVLRNRGEDIVIAVRK